MCFNNSASFLQVISNNLLDLDPKTTYPVKNYFILSGFCVIAAFYSKRFLEDLYERVRKVENKTEIAVKKVEQLEVSTQEIDNPEHLISIKNSSHLSGTKYTEAQYNNVLYAIHNSKYTNRTVNGIMRDLKAPLQEPELNEILNILKDEGILINKMNKKGSEIWSLAE